ncbi:MAG: helix-turn-helix domain-containing protein [Anaerolineaceae bacterium]|nr:helix-turn-helix domain-containing protein [Anaerolineaceae bacterium]
MMTDISKVMLNPIRMRIVQELAVNTEMTSTEINEKMNDVPRTTLYRHINILLENHILTIVSETRIRGSLERTLALNVAEIKKHNTLENASHQALAFLMDRYARFHNYFNSEKANPAKDRIFLNNTIMMMDDNEFDQFLAELQGLLTRYNHETADGRKTRDICVLSVPVDQE